MSVLEKKKSKTIKIWLPAVVLLIAGLCLAGWWMQSKHISQGQRDDYSIKIAEAEKSLNSKEYALALNKYYEATEIIPSNISAYEGIISILLQKNRPSDAFNIVDKSANALSATDKSRLYVMVGDYYYESHDFNRAKEIYQNGIGLGVENMNADLKLGKSLLNLGKINEAKRQFELEGYEDEDLAEANLLKAYIYSLTDFNKASETLLSLTPTDKYVAYYEEFDKVLKSLDTDTKFNSAKLARIFINNGYPYLAINILEPKESEISEYIEGLYYLGRAYTETGQYDRGIEVLEKSLGLGRMQAEVLWTMSRAYVGKNDLDSAIKTYSDTVAFVGKDITKDLAQEYIGFLLKNKQYLKAGESVTTMLTTTQPAFLYILGIQSNYELNEYNKIAYYLEQLGKLSLSDDEKKEYLYWTAKIQLKDEKLEEVNSTLTELLTLDKYNPKYYLLLGRYQIAKGDSTSAKESFKKSIEYDLNNSVTDETLKLLSNIE
ncbi:MAG TPA: tetratricopeptide repeat protein [Candidatus Dojkabacteria bacterium]|nr:tetratricopeptide repeat protein [Candidatus Dojkabacteria bacterium]